ncbi:MAG: MmgE/PrpD family protein [Chloroflexota bacterium]
MPTATFARFAAGLTCESLPENARIAAYRVFLDWLGNAYAGAATPTGKIVYDLVAEEGGTPEAALIGYGASSSAVRAAMVNGATSHIVEFDDIYKNAIYHPGSPTIAAAMAVAQKLRVDGKKLIAGIVAGYEVGTRVGEAIMPSHYKYWHITGTAGTFGAAAAAGNVLGLSAEQMSWALGNAGSQASGLWQFLEDGTMMTKPLHTAKAASNGVLAALLAKRGFNGATRILEGEKGFCNATSTDWSFDKVLPTLGQHYNVVDTTFKAYASCGHTHPAIDCTYAIMAKHGVKPEDVESILVRTYSVAHNIAGRSNPQTTYQAKFSIPFCVATVLRFGRVGMAEFEQERVLDPETVAVMRLVTVEPDPELSAIAPAKRPAIVEITTKSGQRYSHRVDFRKGDPENPPTTKELQDKFRGLASATLSSQEIEATLAAIARLEDVDDVSTMLRK